MSTGVYMGTRSVDKEGEAGQFLQLDPVSNSSGQTALAGKPDSRLASVSPAKFFGII